MADRPGFGWRRHRNGIFLGTPPVNTGAVRFRVEGPILATGLPRQAVVSQAVLERERAAVALQRQQWEAEQAREAAASAKARQLLASLLSPAEHHSLWTLGHLDIEGASGAVYRMRNGYDLVYVMKASPLTGGTKAICIHGMAGMYRLAVDDSLAAMVLMLRADEKRFLEVGVKHDYV